MKEKENENEKELEEILKNVEEIDKMDISNIETYPEDSLFSPSFLIKSGENNTPNILTNINPNSQHAFFEPDSIPKEFTPNIKQLSPSISGEKATETTHTKPKQLKISVKHMNYIADYLTKNDIILSNKNNKPKPKPNKIKSPPPQPKTHKKEQCKIDSTLECLTIEGSSPKPTKTDAEVQTIPNLSLLVDSHTAFSNSKMLTYQNQCELLKDLNDFPTIEARIKDLAEEIEQWKSICATYETQNRTLKHELKLIKKASELTQLTKNKNELNSGSSSTTNLLKKVEFSDNNKTIIYDNSQPVNRRITGKKDYLQRNKNNIKRIQTKNAKVTKNTKFNIICKAEKTHPTIISTPTISNTTKSYEVTEEESASNCNTIPNIAANNIQNKEEHINGKEDTEDFKLSTVKSENGMDFTCSSANMTTASVADDFDFSEHKVAKSKKGKNVGINTDKTFGKSLNLQWSSNMRCIKKNTAKTKCSKENNAIIKKDENTNTDLSLFSLKQIEKIATRIGKLTEIPYSLNLKQYKSSMRSKTKINNASSKNKYKKSKNIVNSAAFDAAHNFLQSVNPQKLKVNGNGNGNKSGANPGRENECIDEDLSENGEKILFLEKPVLRRIKSYSIFEKVNKLKSKQGHIVAALKPSQIPRPFKLIYKLHN